MLTGATRSVLGASFKAVFRYLDFLALQAPRRSEARTGESPHAAFVAEPRALDGDVEILCRTLGLELVALSGVEIEEAGCRGPIGCGADAATRAPS